MNDQIDAALEDFRCGRYRDGEKQLTKYMEEMGCSQSVREIAQGIEQAFNKKSEDTGAPLLLDFVYAPKNQESVRVVGGLSKRCTAEFRLFSLDENRKLKGVAWEFVATYRLVVPVSGTPSCKCCSS